MNQRLELTWIGKDKELKLEPRILIEDKDKSYGDKNASNMLIHGDNLLALKALEQEYTGKIKCIYIDPPYNTGSAFIHYDDNIEHSMWLSLMRDRLVILRNLLKDDGVLWISIDDQECHYLKILLDEVFGRENFVESIIWQKNYSPRNDARYFSSMHDYILVYCKSKDLWRPNLLPRTAEQNKRYTNRDNDPRGPWKAENLAAKRLTEKDVYPITTPSGRIAYPPKGSSWRVSKEKFNQLVEENRIWFGEDGNNVPARKSFLSEVKQGRVPVSLWLREDVGDNQEAKKETLAMNDENVFDTPKPERLIYQIILLSTSPGDIVLDSFLGSGTTASVAHKMGRKWIGIELGEHCYTHCISRLQRVIDGEDKGGITSKVEWIRGGGFKFYELASSLLNKDRFGNWVINKEYNADMLANALCKIQGFKYQPNEEIYWKQGFSNENDYIYVTTNFMTVEHIDKIYSEMKENESVLICCKSYQKECEDRYDNIDIKKIPQAILDKCEFDNDSYSLNVKSIDFDEVRVDDNE